MAQAQPAGTQVAFAKDAGTLSDKFTGLARVMVGKYDWKPGQGVRSVGDVFNLIITENGMLVGVLSGTPNPEGRPAPVAPEKMQDALKASYANLQKDYGTFRQRRGRARGGAYRQPPVSLPRSSNRKYPFRASGFPTDFTIGGRAPGIFGPEE